MGVWCCRVLGVAARYFLVLGIEELEAKGVIENRAKQLTNGSDVVPGLHIDQGRGRRQCWHPICRGVG